MIGILLFGAGLAGFVLGVGVGYVWAYGLPDLPPRSGEGE